jgi:hypothetical protein
LFLDYSHVKIAFLRFKGAITKGEGRNWVKTEDDGIALTGKWSYFH